MNSLVQEVAERTAVLSENSQQEVLDFIEFLQTKQKKRKTLASFSGILKDSPNFNDDPLKIQQRMRDEWD